MKSDADRVPATEWLREAAAQLAQTDSDTPRLDAELLLAHSLGVERGHLLLDMQRSLTPPQCVVADRLLLRRATGEPVAHILETRAFWAHDFKVGPASLIPRADTETLVETGLRHCSESRSVRILDLGTGTGCVLISLLSERPHALGIGLDVVQGAVDLATENARKLGVRNRATFRCGDWFSALEPQDGPFDLIVSNPPYIPSADIEGLMSEVRNYEPRLALDGGPDGLDAVRHILKTAPSRLVPGGSLALEVGVAQAAKVASLAACEGYQCVEIAKDLCGIERVVSARWGTSWDFLLGMPGPSG